MRYAQDLIRPSGTFPKGEGKEVSRDSPGFPSGEAGTALKAT